MSDSKRGANMKDRLIVGLMAVLLLTACSGGDGTSREDLLKLAGESVATVQPTVTTKARIEATVTPDVYLPQPAPFIAPTATPEPPQAMPEPTAAPVVVINVACNVMTPVPTRALSNADRAAGVVVAGGWPCEVQP
jgi:hypothetical protein